jgi:hypothetical protein
MPSICSDFSSQAYLWDDLFTSLVNAPWWRILSFGVFLYLGQWFFFAMLYWKFNNESIVGCNKSMLLSFTDAFILSVDSESTIGFGNYAVESECAPGIFVLVLQVCRASPAFTNVMFSI